MAISAAQVLVQTIGLLSSHAPAIIAAAAGALGRTRLMLFFGDGTAASLAALENRLIAAEPASSASAADKPTVEVHFDDRALALLFDAQRRPTDQILEQSLDVRGSRQEVLAAWRCFSVLSQRAAGMRFVQALWSNYRDQKADGTWSAGPRANAASRRRGTAFWAQSHWPALGYLDRRQPSSTMIEDASEPVRTAARSLWNGRESASWQEQPKIFDNDLQVTMTRCKERVVDEILKLVPRKAPRADLYDLMRKYITREGKGLRPTLTIATCMALGGRMEDAVRAASALEMFHNGFLVHDDIADESTHRRGEPTLHEAFGTGLAVNAGDAMNLFAVDLTLSNLETLGLARTLGLIHEILHMCRETVEGQAIELGWIRRNSVPSRYADYSRMSTKKTGWYTCISPCRMGAVAAGETNPKILDRFNEAFRLIGIAFQIQDDILNLVGETDLYGKEALGDLLEGKRTIMMIHLFRTAPAKVRARMKKMNAMRRADKTQVDAEEMLAAMQKAGSIEYAIGHASRLANKGVKRFEADLSFIEDNPAKAVLRQIANYVTTRML